MDPRVTSQPAPGPAWLVRVETLALWVAAGGVAVLGVLITLSVLGRILSLFQIPDHVIFSGELMVMLVALPWAFVAREQGHIAVEIFTNRVPIAGRVALIVVSAIVGLAMIVPLTYAATDIFLETATRGSYFDGELYWPEWPGRLAFAIGFFLLAIRLIVTLVQALRRLAKGDYQTVNLEDGLF